MKMRKILSFVLVLALVLGSFSMAFATTPADVVGTPNEEAVQVLMGLGVVNGYEDGSFKPDGIVTRAEMAKLLVVALGLEDYAVGTSKFPDMAGATWAQGYVNYAAGLGIIMGYPDGTFKPSMTVSYDEACAMIVRAIGYTDASLLPATWPANYVVKAKSLGILDGVTSSPRGANRGDIAEMLFNSLGLAIGSVDAENKWYANATDPAEDNMLTRLGAEKSTTASIIQGTEDGMINMRAYAGVYGYTYSIDDEIVAVDAESTRLVGTYSKDDDEFEALDGTVYKISDSVGAAATQSWFINQGRKSATGKVDSVSSSTELTLDVDLSGKTVEEIYSFGEWNIATTRDLVPNSSPAAYTSDPFGLGLFTEDDADDIADGELMGFDFVLDEDDNIDTTMFTLVGADSLADINEDDVVYVYAAATGSHLYSDITRIEVGTEVVTGEVTEMSKTDDIMDHDTDVGDKFEYTVNGKTYEFAMFPGGENFDSTITDIEVGAEVEFRLDYAGDIFDYEIVEGNDADMYGVVTIFDTDVYGDVVTKIYTSDDASKRFIVDTDEVDVTPNQFDLVAYGLDNNGDIDAIDLPEEADTAASLKTTKIFTIDGGDYTVASDVVVFTVSGAAVDVSSISDVDTGVTLVGAQFIMADDELVALLVDEAYTTPGTDDDIYAVINTISTVKDGDDTVNKLVGFANGVAITKLTNDTNAVSIDIDELGLITLETNTDGQVTSAIWFVKSDDAMIDAMAKLTDVSDDRTVLTAGTTKYAVEEDAVVYEAVLDGADFDGEYTVAKLSDIRKNYTVWLFDTDEDTDGYDTVIFADSDFVPAS